MDFSNLQIDIAAIPQVESVQLQPIESDYLKALRLTWTILYGIIVAALTVLFFLIDDWQNSWAIAAASIAVVVAVLLTVTIGTGSFKRKSFAVRQHDIIYKNGWLFQDVHVVPFNRIQHVVVNSGPIDRKYGLASLTLYTAAAEVNDIAIPGLKTETAEQLKSFILEQIKPTQQHEGLE
jgi:membrane protein YdbS with pleckstrin-like domain